MDFISNLIKRPISLVINDNTADTNENHPVAGTPTSLPSNLMTSPNAKKSASEDREISQTKNNNVHLKMTSSCHADSKITDLINVTEGYLGEFEDILPPPPLQNNSLIDIESTRSLSVTPPPPSPPLSMEQVSESMITASMKTSQTIDELLSQINDNFREAGLNNDAIALPPNKLELGPLSGKAVLNESKISTSSTKYSSVLNNLTQGNTLKTSVTAAGSASTVFEINSSLHKFETDSELKADLFDDHHQEKQHVEEHQLKMSEIEKSSNKFMGLTEFDETKIPELPDNLNSNTEEQYNITFEECFIPTLTTQQEIKDKITDELCIDRTHLLLPTEADTNSSDNETFADCNDEKDVLAITFSETGNVDATTELESYRSAVNNTLNDMSINDTMENIADLQREEETHPFQQENASVVMQECRDGHNEAREPSHIQEDEPMDIDMNSTIEIMQNTWNNMKNVQNVLLHAENVLQQIEEKKHVENLKQVNSSPDINVTVECSTKINNFETKQSKNKISLENSAEIPIETKNLNSDCNIEQTKSDLDELQRSKLAVNPSIISNSSAKSSSDQGDEAKPSLTINTAVTSQKNSAPSSPLFPIKHAQIEGFPRSPKATANKQPESPFLEKSNYSDNFPTQNKEEIPFIEEYPGELNSAFTELNCDENAIVSQRASDLDENAKNKRRTFSVDQEVAEEKRRTFNIQSNDLQVTNVQFPTAMDKPADNTRRTFCLNEIPIKSEDNKNTRRTFNVNIEEKEAEQAAMNKSFEPMDVDSSTASAVQPITQPIDNLSTVQTSVVAVARQDFLPPLPAARQKTQSPPLPTMQQKISTYSLPISQTEPEVQQISNSPPLPTLQQISQSRVVPPVMQRSKSPPLPTLQKRSQSPPLPTLQKRSQSPPLPAMQQQKLKNQSAQLSSVQQETVIFNEEHTSSTSLDNVVPSSSFNPHLQPLPTLIQKRPSIRDIRSRPDTLSAKEESSLKVKDEKDVFVEKCTPSTEEVFTGVSATPATTLGFSEFDQTSLSSSSPLNKNTEEQQDQFEEEFRGNNNIILNPSDFDYLLTKGNNNTTVDRSSLLLKFDPFLGVPVPVNQGPQQQQQLQLQIPTNPTINPYLSPTFEEDEHNDSNRSLVIETKSVDGVSGGLTKTSAKLLKERSQDIKQQLQFGPQAAQQNKNFSKQGVNKKNATMSVDVIKDMSLDNDCNKAFENSNSTQSDDKQNNYKMDELEKKIKNEVLKTEDIEKKLKDAEQREEALIKRITEKDKTVAKMTGVIEAYEKAIAELIAEKEQLIQNYEKQLAEVKADRDSNYHHLTSLETTFSDLHVKYEKSKEMTCQLKASEEALQAEKRRNLENLHLQEQRYDKMKNHAMQQLEIANKKLESLTRDHSIEITKLKALLKKEEIARSSINEQLTQKTKENAELVKICDELIANQGS